MRTLLLKIKFRRFNREFGFVPAPDDPVFRAAEQRIVEGRLTQLASWFRDAAWNEETSTALLLQRKEAEKVTDVLEAMYALRTSRFLLHNAKQAFWRAHGLAKEAGFAVKAKHAEYLNLSDF